MGPEAFRLHDHTRAAKCWSMKMSSRRGRARAESYRRLLAVMRKTLRYVPEALAAEEECKEPWVREWREDVLGYLDLVERAVDQTDRRVC